LISESTSIGAIRRNWNDALYIVAEDTRAGTVMLTVAGRTGYVVSAYFTSRFELRRLLLNRRYSRGSDQTVWWFGTPLRVRELEENDEDHGEATGG